MPYKLVKVGVPARFTVAWPPPLLACVSCGPMFTSPEPYRSHLSIVTPPTRPTPPPPPFFLCTLVQCVASRACSLWQFSSFPVTFPSLSCSRFDCIACREDVCACVCMRACVGVYFSLPPSLSLSLFQDDCDTKNSKYLQVDCGLRLIFLFFSFFFFCKPLRSSPCLAGVMCAFYFPLVES